jgi:hypothetical protein
MPTAEPLPTSLGPEVWRISSPTVRSREFQRRLRRRPCGYWIYLMIVLGIILVVIGALLNIGFLYALGGILVVVGVILWILGAVGRPVAGRRYYY